MTRRPHPLWLWAQAVRLKPLLLIPAARFLYYALFTRSSLAALWQDAAVAAVLFCLLVRLWWSTRYHTDMHHVITDTCALGRRQALSAHHFTVVEEERTPLSMLLRGRRRRLYTNTASLTLYVPRVITPHTGGVMLPTTAAGRRRYLLPPLLWSGAALLLPLLRYGIVFSLASVFPLLWWLCLRLWSSRHAYLHVATDSLTLCCPRDGGILTVTLPRETVARVDWRQTPFQRRAGVGDVVIFAARRRWRVRGLSAAPCHAALTAYWATQKTGLA